ncbi:putative Thiol-disulfide oxidoreductase ResA [Candidatus Sulfobium mesophilum]|uniref:Putative Thiol-disulfide oxidoreductase ResA n=1 Tax=Candidatus Sulfobium mesophilum TaxID=2016548 RepID=A0A2U3QFR5_9BACT|nr:putative Thiol-disulfide oxidoreductase ResA [Candidatus Sulfobium mesophilum]
MKRLLFILFLLAAFCLAACKGGDGRQPSAAKTAGVAPDFVLRDITGNKVQLSQYRGKIIVLEFWATWCPPCKATVPELIALQDKYAAKGLVVVGIALDEGEGSQSKVSAFSKGHKINYPLLLGDENVSKSYGVFSIPATFLIGRDQKIITAYKGYVDGLEGLLSKEIDKNI